MIHRPFRERHLVGKFGHDSWSDDHIQAKASCVSRGARRAPSGSGNENAIRFGSRASSLPETGRAVVRDAVSAADDGAGAEPIEPYVGTFEGVRVEEPMGDLALRDVEVTIDVAPNGSAVDR